MNKTTKIYLIALLSAIMVCLLTTPVMADYNFDGFPVQTRTSGIANGGVFIDYEPWDGTRALTGNFDVPNGDVKWARLYTGIWGATEDYEGWVNVTFNGVDDRNGLGQIHLQGKNDVNPNVWCSTHGKYWMWYNVTDLVNAGSVNTATTTKINATIGSFDGRVYGIVLVVVYEGGDNPKDIQYWINDGSDGLHYFAWPYPACDTGTTYFNDTVNKDIVSNATLSMVHLTAYEPGCANCLKFNDNPLDTSMVDSNTFELNTWDVTSYVASSGNNAWYSRGEDGYVSVCNAILVLEREVEAVEKPDLLISDISVKHNYYEGVWANLSNTVNVTVANDGTASAGSFKVKLYADAGLVGTQSVSSLAAGASTVVSFGWIPTEARTYSLRAVADAENAVAESDETNNEMTKSQSEGYNGYMGDKPLTTYAHEQIKGDILYTVGDSFYSGKLYSSDTYTVHHTVTIPGGASVKFARLYPYWTWSPTYPDMKLVFDGNEIAPDRQYTDRKGWGVYDYPTGTYAYDVTDYVSESGNYTTVVTDIGTKYFCMDGLGLLVVYTDPNGKDIEYWVNEGCDVLSSLGTSGGLTAEEATTKSLFPGFIDLSKVKDARLWTVVQSGDHLGDVLLFNAMSWSDVYDGTPYPDLDIDEARAVKDYLVANDNLAQIRAAEYPPGDYLVPSNAFLVVEFMR